MCVCVCVCVCTCVCVRVHTMLVEVYVFVGDTVFLYIYIYIYISPMNKYTPTNILNACLIHLALTHRNYPRLANDCPPRVV